MNARQIVEAEDPKYLFRNPVKRERMLYRFSVGLDPDPVTFCFSVIAADESQAIRRANAYLAGSDGIVRPWEGQDDDDVDDAVFHLNAGAPLTAENILDVCALSDAFHNPEATLAEYEKRHGMAR